MLKHWHGSHCHKLYTQLQDECFDTMRDMPEYQNRGIAQTALKEIERMHSNCKCWILDTILEEKGNCHMYEKLGYVKIGEPQAVNDHLTLINYKKDRNKMIRMIKRDEIEECAKIIRSSFSTVAEEFNITEQNCPTHTSFIKPEKLYFQFDKGCPMFAMIKNEKIIGYFSLIPKRDGSAELDNLAVLPEYRHNGYGKEMLEYAFKTAKTMGFNKVQIGIIKENTILKKWYVKNGFVHTGTQKFEHLPFTVGFMECCL